MLDPKDKLSEDDQIKADLDKDPREGIHAESDAVMGVTIDEEKPVEETPPEETPPEEKPPEEEKPAEKEGVIDTDKPAEEVPSVIDSDKPAEEVDVDAYLKTQPESVQKLFRDLRSEKGLWKSRTGKKAEELLADPEVRKELGLSIPGDDRPAATEIPAIPTTPSGETDLYKILGITDEAQKEVIDQYRADPNFAGAIKAEALQFIIPLVSALARMQGQISASDNDTEIASRRKLETTVAGTHKDAKDILSCDVITVSGKPVPRFKSEKFQTYYEGLSEINKSKLSSADPNDVIELVSGYKATMGISMKKKIDSSKDDEQKKKLADSAGAGDLSAVATKTDPEVTDDSIVDSMADERESYKTAPAQ